MKHAFFTWSFWLMRVLIFYTDNCVVYSHQRCFTALATVCWAPPPSFSTTRTIYVKSVALELDQLSTPPRRGEFRYKKKLDINYQQLFYPLFYNITIFILFILVVGSCAHFSPR